MFRRLIASLVCLACLGAVANAAERSGKFVKYDKDTKVLTIRGDNGDEPFTLADDTKVVTAKGEPTKFNILSFSNPKVAKPGAFLTVIYTKEGDAKRVTEIKIGGGRDKK